MTKAQQVAFCERCGRMLRVAGPRNPDAKMLRRAKNPKGLCVNCATHDWLRNTYPVNMQLAEKGPGILLYPHIRDVFRHLLSTACADAKLDEINWNLIVENWELPFPDKVKPSGKNPVTQADLDDLAAGRKKAFGGPVKPDPLPGVHTITTFEQLNTLEPGAGDKLRETFSRLTPQQSEGGAPMARRRKGDGNVAKKRKPVHVRLIERKNAGRIVEVYRVVEDLIADHHSGEVEGQPRNLDKAKILLAWRDGWRPDVDQVLTLARLRKATETDKYVFGADADFIIEVNSEAWPGLSEGRQRMVLDHELYHAAPDLDRNGEQKLDVKERLCWRVRKHAYQEHREMVDRYGVQECLQLAEAGLRSLLDADRPLLQADGQAGEEAPTPGDWRDSDVGIIRRYSNKIKPAHIDKLLDAGMPTLGLLADRMDVMGADWSTGLRIAAGTKTAIEDALGDIRAESEAGDGGE